MNTTPTKFSPTVCRRRWGDSVSECFYGRFKEPGKKWRWHKLYPYQDASQKKWDEMKMAAFMLANLPPLEETSPAPRPRIMPSIRLEAVAVAYLNSTLRNQVVPSGFRGELRRQSRLAQGVKENGWAETFPFKPDGYLKLLIGGRIWLIPIEVEDCNRLTPEKLRAYTDLWAKMDATDTHSFGLLTTDRYGRPSLLDLHDMWHAINGVLNANTEPRPMRRSLDLTTVIGKCAKHRLRKPASLGKERVKMRRLSRLVVEVE